jgi:predicted membrane protein
MKKLMSFVFMLLFVSISLFAQESVEQKKIKEAQKQLEEAKVDHYKKLNEALKMVGARADVGNLKRKAFRGDNVQAVTYTIPFATGILELNFAPDSIEGYDGKEIILKSWVEKEDQELVDGLVLVNSNGVADNTGMGLRAEKKERGDYLSVSELDMYGVKGVKMMVPQSVKLILKYNSTYQNEKITLINLKSEIDVAVRFNPVVIKKISGPTTINSMYGKIDAFFEAEPTKPVSLISSYGDVSVNMPSTSKVDLNIKTTWGKIYIPQSLVGKLQKDANSKENKEQLKGSLNGGGNLFVLSSAWGKIYLRLK